eukprot:TRINITY_DN2249_c0_g1_i2.p1 TRINITY_DN2249_c0_g1~~TRINITY_DN2249_c0_g1_i2.p1  ORF type:complete len:4493 (+),score=1584.60 TRINITY_DN2249_c0_g1_i2:343-13821(+)
MIDPTNVVEVTETRKGTSKTVSGTFKIGDSTSGLWSSDLVITSVSNSQIVSAIEGLGVGSVQVTLQSEDSSGSKQWLVHFTDSTSNIPELLLDVDSLTGTGLEATVTQASSGNILSGEFAVIYGTEPIDALNPVKISSWIPISASEDAMKTALESINDLNPSSTPHPCLACSISVTKTDIGIRNAAKWSVTFTGHIADLNDFAVDKSRILGVGANVKATEVVKGSIPDVQVIQTSAESPMYGTFYVIFNGVRSNPIPFDASASVMTTALENIGVGQVDVTVEGPLSQNLDYKWTVQFLEQGGDVPMLVASATNAFNKFTLFDLFKKGVTVSATKTQAGSGESVDGDFRVSHDNGSTWTRWLANDATQDEVQFALMTDLSTIHSIEVSRGGPYLNGGYSWDVEYYDPSGDVNELIIDESNLTGTGAYGTVSEYRQGSVPEIQTIICTVPAGSTFSCSYTNPETTITTSTSALASDTSEEVMQTEISGLPGIGEVSVLRSGSVVSGFSWEVTFEENTGDLDKLVCVGAAVSATQDGTATAMGGTFKLMNPISKVTSTDLNYQAIATDIENAIENELLMGDVTVTANGPLINGEFEWTIVFNDYIGDVPEITPIFNSASLTGTNAQVLISETIKGNEPHGEFVLRFENENTPSLPLDVSQIGLQNALMSFEGLDAIEVTREPQKANGGYEWLITFKSILDDNSDLAATIGKDSLDFEIYANDTTVEGTNADLQLTVETSPSSPISGTFQLFYMGDTTEALSCRATAEDVKEAFNSLASITGDVEVTRSNPNVGGGFTWNIEFWETAGDVSSLIDFLGAGLSGNNIVLSPTSETVKGSLKIGGQFRLSDGLSWTSLLDYDISSEDLKIALEALSSIHSVSVELESEPLSNNQRTWLVTFDSLFNAGDVPIIQYDQLLSGTNADFTITPETTGQSGEVQGISLTSTTPLSGFFTLTFNGQPTSPLSVDITKEELKLALDDLSTIDEVTIEYRQPTSGLYGFHFAVFFHTALGDVTPLINLTPAYSGTGITMSTYVINDGTTTVLTGSFSLSYGSDCDVAIPTDCDSTGNLGVDVLTSTLQSALLMLNNIPSLVVNEVSEDTITGSKVWDITFTDNEASDISLLKPSSTVGGSGANVIVEEIEKGSTSNSGSVPVEITSNALDFTNDGILYEYHSEVVIESLSPNHGPINGGTIVTITGANFQPLNTAYCRFGDNIDPEFLVVTPVYKYIDEEHVQCIAPPVSNGRRIYVQVTLNVFSEQNTMDWSESFISYTYDEPVDVVRVLPTSGPVTGNTTVHVYGHNFIQTTETRCKFGDKVVQGIWITSGEIVCQSPIHMNGHYPLEISQNNQDYSVYAATFRFYELEYVSYFKPQSGPAVIAGTEVTITGSGFINSSQLSCKFGQRTVPAEFISSTSIKCSAPPTSLASLSYQRLSDQQHLKNHPLHDDADNQKQLFPDSYFYPKFPSRLVPLEVANNGFDFTDDGVHYLYQEDATVGDVSPKTGNDNGHTPLFVIGTNFVNSTALKCRIGATVVDATFLTTELVLCFTPKQSRQSASHGQLRHGMIRQPGYEYADQARVWYESVGTVFVEVTNNGLDYTSDRKIFDFNEPCPSGHFCPAGVLSGTFECPKGTYCPGLGNQNFTLCPRGTYQPMSKQSVCTRCPIGYICPEFGMHVPRICPAGFVCDVTGIEKADQPCPEGHFCLEGTATTATTCGAPGYISSRYSASLTHAERHSTIRPGREASGLNLSVGARQAACWNNATDDFGLQVSNYPARFWMEVHQLPLDPDTPFTPSRGRFCLDDKCMRLSDADDMTVADYSFDYDSSDFALRRPVPCPAGSYCHPGTAVNVTNARDFTTPQPCFERMYCPEGTPIPQGTGDCPKGFYCPFAEKIRCPVGTYCPREGLHEPLPCPPGTFNGMVGMEICTECPLGFICPGFGRVDPAACPPGKVCSEKKLSSPNQLCPAGLYCPSGTVTIDPFRSDTTLRPYPCRPGTYCMSGVGYDTVVVGDFLYAQHCTEGFFCEAGSYSPKGSGLCPKGFICPEGTSVPIPTPVGTHSELIGMVKAASCLPGTYAPTIESVYCYPCPPGTQCDNDGMDAATICPPGSYRSTEEVDGILCVGCPQGTWSKNWELRSQSECAFCPPGVVCPMDGITDPCSVSDFPTLYVPTNQGESEHICLAKGSAYYFGTLSDPIDSRGHGPNFAYNEDGECYTNEQPDGSVLYQRYKDYYGKHHELRTGELHQGYGEEVYAGFYGKGSLRINLESSRVYDPATQCEQGFFLYNDTTSTEQWYPGTCEADIICYSTEKAQANPCSEGYVCDHRTTALVSLDEPCPAGYVCDFGSTPDSNLHAPMGQYKKLCTAGYMCREGTGLNQELRNLCQGNYFCPSGTAEAIMGQIAEDSVNRQLTAAEADPFSNIIETKLLPEERLPRDISTHDQECFNGINAELLAQTITISTPTGSAKVNAATDHNMLCGRDHKWRLINDAIDRLDCNCITQVEIAIEVYRLWKCTMSEDPTCEFHENLDDTGDVTVYHGSVWSADDNTYKLATGVQLPSTSAALRYYRYNCETVDTIRDCNDDTQTADLLTNAEECPQFCTYNEIKGWVEPRYDVQLNSRLGGTGSEIDSFLFDIKYAVDLLDDSTTILTKEEINYYQQTKERKGIMANQYPDDDNWYLKDDFPDWVKIVDSDPYRLDMCNCQNLLKCPNGTISEVGSDSILDCVWSGNEVLRRIVPIPHDTDLLTEKDEYKMLNDVYEPEQGIGTVSLQPLEVAVLTLNLTGLATNFTYSDHYRLSVHVDCKPCPPRYQCDTDSISPRTCSYPSIEQQQKYAEWVGSEAGLCENCCDCERHSLPYWFDVNKASDNENHKFWPYFDNKHTYMQISVAAIRQVNLTMSLELLNGLHYVAFERDFQEIGDLYVHKPRRANYVDENAATPDPKGFFAIISESGMDGRTMPLNLPHQSVRTAGTNTYETTFENSILIDHVANINVGSPGYYDREALRDAGVDISASSTSDATAGDAAGGRRLGEIYASASTEEDQLAAVQRRDLAQSDSENTIAWGSCGSASTNEANEVCCCSTHIASGNKTCLIDEECSVLDGHEWLDVTLDVLADVLYDATWWQKGDDGKVVEAIALPYLPFFSNCEGYDSHIYISKLLEDHPDCHMEPVESTIYVDEWFWNNQMTPQSDYCKRVETEDEATLGQTVGGIEIFCQYEEDIFAPSSATRWFEVPIATELWHMNKEPIAASDFIADDDSNVKWGRSAQFTSIIGTENVVGANVEADGGKETLVPRTVALEIQYYQVDVNSKRIVGSTVGFTNFCTTTSDEGTLASYRSQNPPILPCKEGEYGYVLEFLWTPLGYMELLNMFEFSTMVYILLFFIIGLTLSCIGACVWSCNRLLSRVKNPPIFRFFSLLNVVYKAPLQGISLASVPVFTVFFIILTWFIYTKSADPVAEPNTYSFEDTSGDWLDTLMLTTDRIQKYKFGRVGVAFVCCGFYLIMVGVRLFIPDHSLDQHLSDDANAEDPLDAVDVMADVDLNPVPPSKYWRPILWKRTHMVFSSFMLQLVLLWIWEFSYSHWFSDNQYQFIVLFKIIQMIFDMILGAYMRENLLIAPLMVMIELTEILVTMGAEDFTDFTVAYFVETALMILERLYVDPFMKYMSAVWPKWKMIIKRKFQKRRKMTRKQRQEQEKKWKHICEHVVQAKEGVEPMMESYFVYSNETAALMMSFFLQVILLLTDANPFSSTTTRITQIPELYGIRDTDLKFYTIFTVMIVPASLFMDMFLLNAQELIHGWKMFEYVSYQQYRFSVREFRWQMSQRFVDESVDPALQTVDALCFSSQFHFMTALHTYGILLMMLGFTIFLRLNYYVFGDIMFPVIMIICFIICAITNFLCRLIGDLVGLWRLKVAEGTVDDDVAAKLAIGEGRGEDLEQERLELQAMNSERFRHRFLEKSRPWILQHLSELLNPRTLQMPGADGRPNIEYIRDVYTDLLKMGEGRRRAGDRSDISSDSDDEALAKRRREWSRATISPTGAELLKLWYERAKRRLLYGKLVKGIIKNSCKDECELCHKTTDMGAIMQADLLLDGEPHPRALEKIMEAYEAERDGKTFDADLWKAFFRKNAKFITRCDTCRNSVQDKKRHRTAARMPGEGRKTRAADISSDESEEEEVFEPMVIARNAVEGRTVIKWLNAARRRLGGTFPRPNAKAEVEEYIANMRKRHLRRKRRAEMEKADEDEMPFYQTLHMSATSVALMQRWLHKSREALIARERVRTLQLRKQIETLMVSLPEEEDYLHGAEIRLKGENLVSEVPKLQEFRRRMDAEENKRLHQAELDLTNFQKIKQEEADENETLFTEELEKIANDINDSVEPRLNELKAQRIALEDEYMKRREEVEPAYRARMVKYQEEELKKLDDTSAEIRKQADLKIEAKQQKLKDEHEFASKQIKTVLEARSKSTKKKLLQIKQETLAKIRKEEANWTQSALIWLEKARKKVDSKSKKSDGKTKRK